MSNTNTAAVPDAAPPVETSTVPTVDLDTADFSSYDDDIAPEGVTDQSAGGEANDATPADPVADPKGDTPAENSPPTETEPTEPEKAEEPAEPAKDEESTSAKEAAPPADDKTATDRQAAIQQFQADYGAFQKKLADGNFDPIDDGTAAFKTLAKGLELLNEELGSVRQQHVQQQQQTSAQKFWGDFEAKHPHIGAKQGQQLFQAEVDTWAKRGFKGEALRAAATGAWERRIEAMKTAPAPAKAPIKAPPVTKGAARVTPSGTGTTPPKPSNRSLDERIEAGEYGNLRNELDL